MRKYEWQQVAVVGMVFSFVGLASYGFYNVLQQMQKPM